MEEVVRAFNYVIERGWVRPFQHDFSFHSVRILNVFRHFTGGRHNGQPVKSKKRIVCYQSSSLFRLLDSDMFQQMLHLAFTWLRLLLTSAYISEQLD